MSVIACAESSRSASGSMASICAQEERCVRERRWLLLSAEAACARLLALHFERGDVIRGEFPKRVRQRARRLKEFLILKCGC